jgi:hypothetical protein
MITAAETAYRPPVTATCPTIIALPSAVKVNNLSQAAANETGWTALAIEIGADGVRRYVIVKGSEEATLPPSSLEFT